MKVVKTATTSNCRVQGLSGDFLRTIILRIDLNDERISMLFFVIT